MVVRMGVMVKRKYRRIGWTDAQIEQLKALREHQPITNRPVTFREIGEIMGRQGKAVQAKWDKVRRGFIPRKVRFEIKRAHNIPDHVLQERDYAQLHDRRDTTAIFNGDPLPGRSALERRFIDEPRTSLSEVQKINWARIKASRARQIAKRELIEVSG